MKFNKIHILLLSTMSGGVLADTIYSDTDVATGLLDTATSGNIYFYGQSSAGSSTIIVENGAKVLFDNNSTGGQATITNQGNAQTAFSSYRHSDSTLTAGNAFITNNDDSNTLFYNNGHALNIINNVTTAGNATIINNNNSHTLFDSEAFTLAGGDNITTVTADHANITNNDNSYTAFTSNSSYASTSTAGNATITNNDNGYTTFGYTSDSGNARLINQTGCTGCYVDFTNSVGAKNNNQQTAGSIEGGGEFRLGANTLTTGSNDLSTTVTGIITGTGGLVKTGAGTLTLAGENTYTGTTTVNAGSALALGNGGTTGMVSGTLVDNGTLIFNHSNDLTYAGVISGSGVLTQAGTGTLILTADNTYTGSTTINNGATLSLGQSTSTGMVSGPVVDNGTLVFNHSNDLMYAGVISGSGFLTQAGTGTLILTADNTYTGSTTINNGATLSLGNGGTTGMVSGPVVDNGTLVFNHSNDLTVANTISGSGDLTQDGTGVLTLTGDNTYTGNTLIATGKTLSLGRGGTTGSVAGNITNEGLLIFNRSNNYTQNGVLSGDGTLTKNGAGTLTLTGQNSSQGAVTVIRGTLDFAQAGLFGASMLNVVSRSTVKLEDTARLAVSGDAALRGDLDVNIATGGPLITADRIALGANSALTVTGLSSDIPDTASAVAQSRTTVLQTTRGITGDFASVNFGTTDAPDYLLIDGKKSADTLSYSVGSELAWTSGGTGANGNFTLSAPTDHFNVDVTLADQAANSATGWSGKDLTKAGDGNLILSAVNTYSGATTINGGTLTTGVAHTLDASSGVSIASGAALNLSGFDQNVNALSGTGNITLGSATLGVVSATANNEFDGVISGNGSLSKTGTGTLVLSGENTFTGDTTLSSGTLQVGNGGTAGSLTGNIVNNAALVFNRSDASAYNRVISGTGKVTKDGAGSLTLTGANTYGGGTVIDAGTLSLAQAQAIGTGTALINSGGTLDLVFNNATFANAVSGNGKAQVSGTAVALEGDNSAFTGAWDITGGAVVTQASQLGGAGVQLDGAGSLLTLNNFSNDFGNALSGNGTLQVNQSSRNDDFTFVSTTGSAFTGTVQMQQGNMVLDGNAAQTLTNATLVLSPNGMTTLDADRSIGGLTSGGGVLRINNSRTEAYTLTTETLDASAGGSIAANVPAGLTPPVIPVNKSYFDQDAIRTLQAVNTTGTVNGVGNHMSLYHYDGVTPTSAPTLVNITDGAGQLGVATYDYSAVVTSDGVWLGYDLLKLNANAGQTITLDNEPGQDNALIAQLTGAGSFDVRGTGTVILNNTANDYTGNTAVSSGILQLGSDHALGNTADVSIAANAGLDINGKTQTITTLHGAAGSTLNLGNGALTLAQGGVSQGQLTGSGRLNLEGGQLQVNGANAGMSAVTQIASSAQAVLDNAQGLGTGAITVDGNLSLSGANGTLSNQLSGGGSLALQNGAQVSLSNTLNTLSGHVNVASGTQLTALGAGTLGTAGVTDEGSVVLDTATDWTLTNTISGSGGLTKTGSGTLIVNNGLTYSGDTHINEGTLQIGDAPGSLDSTGTVYVDTVGTLRGNGRVGGSVVNNGRLGMLSDTPSQLLIAGDLENNNVVDLTNNAAGNTLTVEGNYSSNGGQLWLNSELNGDSSATDELLVNGNTRGNTLVTVNNMHGLGEQTVNGIEVVNVQGQSDGTFTLQGRAVAGAYEYSLYQGTPTENDGNWYLRSQTGDPGPGPQTPVLRPEAGAYLMNQSLANSVFLTTMHDRSGENRQTGDDSPATWAHFDAGRVNSEAAGGAISSGSNTAVLRIGSDIYRHDFGNQQIKAGVMTGYADVNTHSDAQGVSGSTDSNLKGYNFGLYGTWYGGSAEQKTGPYVDSWVQYGTFHNTVNGSDLPEEKYHSHNWTGSVEAGYDIQVSEAHNLYLQPQFQTIYSDYSQGDHKESNGTRIRSQDSGGVTTRLGGRFYGQIENAGLTQPFVELNWWHGGSSNSIQMDTTTVDQNIPVNRYEVKVGAQTNVSKNWLMWINTGVQAGKDDYSSVQGQVGGKYSW